MSLYKLTGDPLHVVGTPPNPREPVWLAADQKGARAAGRGFGRRDGLVPSRHYPAKEARCASNCAPNALRSRAIAAIAARPSSREAYRRGSSPNTRSRATEVSRGSRYTSTNSGRRYHRIDVSHLAAWSLLKSRSFAHSISSALYTRIVPVQSQAISHIRSRCSWPRPPPPFPVRSRSAPAVPRARSRCPRCGRQR